MRAVARPMPLSVMRNVYLRPTMSPMRPKTKAPNGRIRNPAVKVPTGLMSAVPAAAAEDVEVVPLDHVPDSCGDDDTPQVLRGELRSSHNSLKGRVEG